MSLSRTALVLGFLVLTACGTATTSSGPLPSLPSGGAGAAAPQGNTPSSGERPMTSVDRPSPGTAHAIREPRTVSFSCRSCRY